MNLSIASRPPRKRTRMVRHRLEKIDETFGVVVANLDAPTLRQVGPDLAARVAPGGSLIVSGLRRGEAWEAPPGWTRVETASEGAWIAERWGRSV